MKKNLIALIVALTASTSSFAATFDFANLKNGTGFLPTDGINCTGGDKCSSNVNGGNLGGDLNFTSGGITVAATGYYDDPNIQGNVYSQVAVVQDHDDGYNGLLYGSTAKGAGLGVYHKSGDNGDDNITGGEMLKLSFDRTVMMSEFGMRAEGHNTTAWRTNGTFQYSIDGLSWISALLPDNNVAGVGNANAGRFQLGLTSKDFYFRYGGTTPDQFYISSATVSAVPLPPAFALMLPALGMFGFISRRKRQTAA